MLQSIRNNLRGVLVGCGMLLLFTVAICVPTVALDRKVAQVAGVENSAMGAYRALAQLAFQAFKKGDLPIAAKLARVLERTWDAAEEHGGPISLGVKNKPLFEEIDQSMDAFIKPIMRYNPVRPGKTSTETAYKALLTQLNAENQGTYRGQATSAYEALQKDDWVNASQLAIKLIHDWYSGTQELRKSDGDTWSAATRSLILFAQPIAAYHPEVPDAANVENAYKNYLEKLNKGDEQKQPAE